MGQESHRETLPPFGRDKNRTAKPSRRSGETRIAPRNLPAVRERQESRRETFPRLRVRLESCRETLPPFGRDKNRAAKPSRRSGETRIAPRNLAAEWFGSGNSVSSFPTSDLGQETVFLASRRVVWSKKRVFFLSRRLGETRNVRKFTRVRRIPLYVRSPVIAKL